VLCQPIGLLSATNTTAIVFKPDDPIATDAVWNSVGYGSPVLPPVVQTTGAFQFNRQTAPSQRAGIRVRQLADAACESVPDLWHSTSRICLGAAGQKPRTMRKRQQGEEPQDDFVAWLARPGQARARVGCGRSRYIAE
jgi:hypothetical protein